MKKKLCFVLACMLALTFLVPGNIAFAGDNDSSAWKAAYRSFMEKAREDAAAEAERAEETDGYSDVELYWYALYDINKDGTPELILHFGFSEAFEVYRFYTFRNGDVVLLKEYACGGDYLATYPDGNGILRCHARWHYQTVFLWTMSGSTIVGSDNGADSIFREDEVFGNYTEIGEIVKGAVTINEYSVDELQPLLRYEEWDPYRQPKAPTASAGQTQDLSDVGSDASLFLRVFNDQQPVIPSLIDPQEYETEPEAKETLLSDFVRLMAENRGVEFTPERIQDSRGNVFYVDLNGDGKCEAVFGSDPAGEEAYSIILSEQSGKVYAYGLRYYPVTGADPSGILYSYYEDPDTNGYIYYERTFRPVFDRENCFLVNVPFINYAGERARTPKPGIAVTAGAPLACGAYHTIGLKSDGTVLAVGSNRAGQSKVNGWTDIVSLSAAGSFTGGQKTDYSVGLRSDGTVVATGNNRKGQCNVSDWEDIVAIAAGGEHTVGLRSDGTVVATGSNKYGQCDVGQWTDIVAVAACLDHTVGLRADGTVVAAGSNKHGQCDVSKWKDIVAIAAGEGYCPFTIGLKANGRVVATGNNKFGACNVKGWRNIVAIAAGGDHAVGLKSDGTVVAVGWNDEGQCNVSKWKDIVAIAAGTVHTVGLKANGKVVATGLNICGQCGVSKWREIGMD